MTEIVKELIVKIKQEIKLCNSALSLRTLEDLINKYENKLAEKDRKIDLLLTANREITYSSKSREYNQPKLYKEDFNYLKICDVCQEYEDKCNNWTYPPNHKEYYKKYFVLIDNSKYDTLPSKDVK